LQSPETDAHQANPLNDLLPGLGTPVRFSIPSESASFGKSLSELSLRGATGATVLAIMREPAEIILPTGKERLRPGDALLLAGNDAAITLARELLSRSHHST
jgi:monovalent cation:H+ antiporter-2, CPA2 family